jgi:hypothetical protein
LLSPDAWAKKKPLKKGLLKWGMQRKKNGRPAPVFRRGKTECRTQLTMLPPGKRLALYAAALADQAIRSQTGKRLLTDFCAGANIHKKQMVGWRVWRYKK